MVSFIQSCILPMHQSHGKGDWCQMCSEGDIFAQKIGALAPQRLWPEGLATVVSCCFFLVWVEYLCEDIFPWCEV